VNTDHLGEPGLAEPSLLSELPQSSPEILQELVLL
jgi:hypothetical protein